MRRRATHRFAWLALACLGCAPPAIPSAGFDVGMRDVGIDAYVPRGDAASVDASDTDGAESDAATMDDASRADDASIADDDAATTDDASRAEDAGIVEHDAAAADATRDDAATTDAASPHDAGSLHDAGPTGPCNLFAEFGTPALLFGAVDTAMDESDASLSADERTLYYYAPDPFDPSSLVLWVAQRTALDAPFGVGSPVVGVLPFPITSFVTDDQLSVYASRQAPDLEWGIAVETRSVVGGAWAAPVWIDALNSPGSNERAPTLGDGVFYTQSDRGGGVWHLYASMAVAGDWSMPVRMDALATTDGEQSPVVSSDGRELYYRRPIGTDDVLMRSVRAGSGLFETASPVPSLQSSYIDVPDWISPDGCRLYLTSKRDGGDADIFVAARP